MKFSQIGRPSPALVVALIALFVAVPGVSFAVGGRDSGKPKATASNGKADSARRRGRRGPRGRRGKEGKQGPLGPSDGYVTNHPEQTALAAGADTTVATLKLPAGSYLLSAHTALGNNAASANLVSCSLRTPSGVSTGNANLSPQAVFSQTISLTGSSPGGTVNLTCNPDNGAQARSRVITAVKVGSLHTQ